MHLLQIVRVENVVIVLEVFIVVDLQSVNPLHIDSWQYICKPFEKVPKNVKTRKNYWDLIFRVNLIPRMRTCSEDKLTQQILGVDCVLKCPCRCLLGYDLINFAGVVFNLQRDVVLYQQIWETIQNSLHVRLGEIHDFKPRNNIQYQTLNYLLVYRSVRENLRNDSEEFRPLKLAVEQALAILPRVVILESDLGAYSLNYVHHIFPIKVWLSQSTRIRMHLHLHQIFGFCAVVFVETNFAVPGVSRLKLKTPGKL